MPTTSRRREPEAAPDKYQAPFAPPSKPIAQAHAQDDGHDLAAMPSSPFFDEQEHAEALQWAQFHEADVEDTFSSEAMAIAGGNRRRRDSQLSSYGDLGSVFDGPTADVVPSSVSSMRHTMTRPELSRKASSRVRYRLSQDGYSHSPFRSRKQSTSYDEDRFSAFGGDGSVDIEDTASVVSAGPASIRSSGAHSSARLGKKRRVQGLDVNEETTPSRGMLGSLLASIRGDRVQDDDSRSRASRRPSLTGRRRSSTSSANSHRSRSAGSEAGCYDAQEQHNNDHDFGLQYGSDEDDEDEDDSGRSTTSSEDGNSNRGVLLPSAFGPLSGAVDPVFGDTRITTEHEPEDNLDDELQNASGIRHPRGSVLHDIEVAAPDPEEELRRAREEFSYLNKDSRSRQQIYLPDEDTLIRLIGYRVIGPKKIVWIIVCVLSLGVMYLLGRWLPKLWLRWTSKEVEFERAEFVVVENQYGDLHMVYPETVPFARPLATAFPPSSRDQPSTLSEHQISVQTQSEAAGKINSGAAIIQAGSKSGSTKSNIKSCRHSNGHGKVVPTCDGQLILADELPRLLSGVGTEQLMDITLMTYRYTRFYLYPPSGRWRMVKDWRDPAWTSNSSVSSGITWDAEKDRLSLFGKNEIEVEDKGVIGLLFDEVLHPFYSECYSSVSFKHSMVAILSSSHAHDFCLNSFPNRVHRVVVN